MSDPRSILPPMQNSDRVIAFQDLGDADLYVGAVYLGGTKKTIADEPLAKLLPVGNQGGFRPAGSVKEGRVHFAVLFTSGKEREWPDRLDPETGVLTYFGDNRKPGRGLHDTTRNGNLLLRSSFAAARGDACNRKTVPPFLLFQKVGTGRDVRFAGLVAPRVSSGDQDADLAVVRPVAKGVEVENYRAQFSLLDTGVVHRDWLMAIAAGADTTNDLCPDAWRKWVSHGEASVQRSVTPADPESTQAELLDALHRLTVHRQDNIAAFYQYVVLLWAMSRPDDSRLTAYSAAQEQLRDLLAPFALGRSSPDPAMPWIALSQSPWWEISLPEGAHREGIRPRDVVRRFDPEAGLSEQAHALVFGDEDFRRRAVEGIVDIRGRGSELDALLDRLGLGGGRRGAGSAAVADRPDNATLGRRATVTDLSPEDAHTEVFERSSPAPGVAERREAELQKRYRDYLESAGHTTCRQRIDLPGGSHPLYTDLFCMTTRELIEVKSDSGRVTMRLALGQVLDYARYVAPISAAVVVPDEPAPDMADLLLRNGIAVVWEDEPGRFHRRDPDDHAVGSGSDLSARD